MIAGGRRVGDVRVFSPRRHGGYGDRTENAELCGCAVHHQLFSVAVRAFHASVVNTEPYEQRFFTQESVPDMQIFLTGASGYIGGAVADRLRAAGHDVSGLARSEAAAAKLTAAGIRP